MEKNLKECSSGIQFKKVSHWANLKHIKPYHFNQFKQFLLNWRAFFWIFNKKVKAVLTVEAAFIVPMFLLALCTLLGVLDCYRIQSIVKTSIHQSAMELGMYAYVQEDDGTDIDVVNSALCITYAQSNLPEFGDNVSVSMVGSYYKDNTITLAATIKYSFPITLFPIPALKMINVSEVYSWVGQENSDDENDSGDITYQMVYVTEHASVYHTSSSCSHIDRKIYQSQKSKLDQKYDVCEKCCKGQTIEMNQTIYYTKTGDCYHVQKNCSSLKRTVSLVEFSQVQYLPLCELCEKRG